MTKILHSGEIKVRYSIAPSVVKAAISAILLHEDIIDDMGYDLEYYQEDLLNVVKEAIAPWKGL